MSNTWWKDEGELVKEQAELLNISPDDSVLIKGPPGSGKTNLLLLKANQLYLGERPNLHVVVFGSLLRNFIKQGGAQYKFPEEKPERNASDVPIKEDDHGPDALRYLFLQLKFGLVKDDKPLEFDMQKQMNDYGLI